MVLRGTALRDAAILRVLAVERGIRGVLLVLLAYGIYAFNGSRNSLRQVFDEYLPLLRPVTDRLGIDLESAGPVRLIEKALNAQHSTLLMVAAGVLAYGVLELVEAVGLWMMKRWGEYVAVVGTSVFIPLEVYELVEQVTWLRVRRVRAERLRGGLPALDQAAVRDPRRQGGLRGRAGGHLAARGGARRRRRGAGAAASPGGPGGLSDGQPAAPQLRAQLDLAGEPDRVDPGPGAAATLAAESSTNTHVPRGRPIRSRSRSKIAGSGLARPLGPGDDDVGEQAQEVVRASACGNSSSDQLVSAKSGYAGRVQVAQHRDVGVDRRRRC